MFAADFEVEAGVAVEDVELPLVEASAAAVPDAGRDESTASAVYVAVNPVALVQDVGMLVAVPETKFTAAHCLSLAPPVSN
jgi:hypothetical protein